MRTQHTSPYARTHANRHACIDTHTLTLSGYRHQHTHTHTQSHNHTHTQSHTHTHTPLAHTCTCVHFTRAHAQCCACHVHQHVQHGKRSPDRQGLWQSATRRACRLYLQQRRRGRWTAASLGVDESRRPLEKSYVSIFCFLSGASLFRGNQIPLPSSFLSHGLEGHAAAAMRFVGHGGVSVLAVGSKRCPGGEHGAGTRRCHGPAGDSAPTIHQRPSA